ncbi:C40 family peptidase [Catenuloplanes atrovinosus]|uniref:Cell wall-associated NlpC family hydrolase n=1 Tax=Catenuloplanes atrovinosus TaxID=137266 RepID=A0AAE3YUS8_9ACTN|nr:NlpC/P60 family protein [Catenuloplanes atrovinosus]MDR7278814.1 cell wall-associated NlpC family hydrolase [Catenuloplanes atrovinosus]
MSASRAILRATVLAAIAVGVLAPATAVHAEPSSADLTKQIDKASHELEVVIESYNKLNEELKATQAAAKQLSDKTAALEEQVKEASTSVGQLANRAYKSGRFGEANTLLTLTDSQDLVAGLSVLEQLAETRNDEVAVYTATEAQYAEEKAKLDAAEKKQKAQRDEAAKRRAGIEGELKNLYSLRKAAYGREQEEAAARTPVNNGGNNGGGGSNGGGGNNGGGAVPSAPAGSSSVVQFAYAQLGKPYIYGSAGPNGFDCSGLVKAAWATAGKSLPHNAAMQWNVVAHIPASAVKPGDMVFYRDLAHVAIAIGGGKVIHAPRPGEVLTIAPINMMPPYGYGRVR